MPVLSCPPAKTFRVPCPALPLSRSISPSSCSSSQGAPRQDAALIYSSISTSAGPAMFPSSLKTQPAGLHHGFVFAHHPVRGTDPLREASQSILPGSHTLQHMAACGDRNSVCFSHLAWWKQRNGGFEKVGGKYKHCSKTERKSPAQRQDLLGGCAETGVLLHLWAHWTRFPAHSTANFSWVMWIHPNQLLPTPGIWAFQPSNRCLRWQRSAGSFYSSSEAGKVLIMQVFSINLSKSWYTSPCQILYFPSDPPLASPEQISLEAEGSLQRQHPGYSHPSAYSDRTESTAPAHSGIFWSY